MGRRKKKDTAYRAAVGIASGLLRILVYMCLALAVIYAGKTAYRFGYLIFDQHPAAATKEEGQDVTVVVNEDDTVYDVGKMLHEKGLIENPKTFWAREKLSDYRGKIQPGTYLLNTYQDVEQILEILARENTEGQPFADEEETSGEGAGR